MQANPIKQKLQALAQHRESLEHELFQITDYLQSCGAGLNGPLVDDEGFPRADIDVYNIRVMRNKRACLVTDLNQLMKEIESNLHSLHAEFSSEPEPEQPRTPFIPPPVESLVKCCWVTDVVAHSQAAQAGLQIGD